MYITFEKNGVRKQVKKGFSWTCLLFGMWVPLLRGMLVPAIVFVLTMGFAGLYYIFTINKLYARHLAENGWTVAYSDKQAAREAWGIQ